jgi:hypothetical protein
MISHSQTAGSGGTHFMTESANEIRRRLAALEERYAGELASAEAKFAEVAQNTLAHWDKWWRDPEALSELAVEARMHDKFVMCFPLAAHAMNHIEAALTARESFPWISKASTRIAFEHALTAQWVLMTEDGERKLKASFDNKDHIRSDRFVKGVQRLGRDDEAFAQAAHGLSDAQLKELVQARSNGPGPATIEGMCQRFASGGAECLLYDIYRELSGSVHPSLSLLRAHLHLDSSGRVRQVDTSGKAAGEITFGRELALSAMWALYAVEVCRFGQPHMAQVDSMGMAAGLPVDLRNSDMRPDEQPKDHSAYWRAS